MSLLKLKKKKCHPFVLNMSRTMQGDVKVNTRALQPSVSGKYLNLFFSEVFIVCTVFFLPGLYENALQFLLHRFTDNLRWESILTPRQTRTQCCRHKCLPVRAPFVADTKNVSDFVQKHFVSATNVMFPSLRSPRNIMGNNVSATICPSLPGPFINQHFFVDQLVVLTGVRETNCFIT